MTEEGMAFHWIFLRKNSNCAGLKRRNVLTGVGRLPLQLVAELNFDLHEGHAFGHNDQGDQSVAEESLQIVHRFMVDAIDAQGEPVGAVLRDKFAFVGMDLLDDVVEPFEELRVVELRMHARQRFTGKPAALVVGVEDFEIVAFDFDDQPHLVRELELITIVFRSARDEVADVDGAGLQAYLAVWTAQTNSGIDSRSMCAFGPQAAHFGSR